MKYGKDMNELKVSEWDSKYLNYKEGKTTIKKACLRIPDSARSHHGKLHNPINILLHGRDRSGFHKLPQADESPPESPPSNPSHPHGNPELDDEPPADEGTMRSQLSVMSTPIKRSKEPRPTSWVSTASGTTSSNFTPPPLMKRVTEMFQNQRNASPRLKKMKTQIIRDMTYAQASAEKEFTTWVDGELEKVERFYKEREDEAVKRFRALEEQLVIMQEKAGRGSYTNILMDTFRGRDSGLNNSSYFSLGKQDSEASGAAVIGYDNLHELFRTPGEEGRMDYQRSNKYRKPINKPVDKAVRRSLKYACFEYYRRLEALRSYVVVNKEGFRKILKKFDKASGSGLQGRYMNTRVAKSYFGGTDNKMDALLNATEILVAKFFYANDRRKAAAKLRTKSNKSNCNASLLRSGIYLGASVIILHYAIWEAILNVRGLNTNGKDITDLDHDGIEDLSERTIFIMRWRLSLSGFYHVEFKDFWLGDMLSSQAYALGQTFLFFCLYSKAWQSPVFWDIVMDWSLMNPYAKNPLLRDDLFYKRPVFYYLAMVANGLLRYTWVLFIFLKEYKKWAPLISFLIAMGEVFRRFIWCFFRMENEHKGNVQAMRAYKDPKLPYKFEQSDELEEIPVTPAMEHGREPLIPSHDVEAVQKPPVSAMVRLGRTLSNAHRSDYERKSRKGVDEDIEEEEGSEAGEKK
ncbi:SPX domain-containing protein [Pyronema omphalodes]|nr:SPX domain-containing protein [Pyronema omphalodes]